jgi:hypothetical protein
MKLRFHILVLVLMAVVAAACGRGPDVTGGTQGYPVPTATQAPAAGYPDETTSTPVPGAVPVVLDRPLKAGATVVTGSGPAGVVLTVRNITLMGVDLGGGTVGEDNRFSIEVTPLEANTRIGVEVTDSGSSGRDFNEFFADDYKGPGALMMPQVGYFTDTALVEP